MPSSSPVIRNEIEPLRLAAVGGEMIERRRDLAGDRALHVDGAAAVQHAVGDVGRERRMRPRLGIAGRHHVGVAGEHQMRRAGADAGVEVLDIGGARLGERHPVHGEARALQHAFRERSARRLPPASPTGSEEIAGDGDGIGGVVMQRLYPALRRSRQFERSGRCPHRRDCRRLERIGAVPVGTDGAAQATQLDESPDADGEGGEPEDAGDQRWSLP